MVFVRTHLIKGRLSVAQKEELGAKLIQAVADVEGLVNNAENQKTSWVQFTRSTPRTGTPRPLSPAPAPAPGSNSTALPRISLSIPLTGPPRSRAKPTRCAN